MHAYHTRPRTCWLPSYQPVVELSHQPVVELSYQLVVELIITQSARCRGHHQLIVELLG